MEEPKKMTDELWYELVTVLVADEKGFRAERHLVNECSEKELKQMTTFKGILKFFKIKPVKAMSIELILENALDGQIWKYNYEDNLWYYYGNTRGYV